MYLTVILVAVAFLAAFAEATCFNTKVVLGAQIDLLPGLMVYAGLSLSLAGVAMVAVFGGLFLDALSANPPGISILPLFLVGVIIERYRPLILRDQAVAQAMLGIGANAAVPLLVLLLLASRGELPLLGWGSIWQWMVASFGSGLVTPLIFIGFERIHMALSYQPQTETTFRPDREIKRGR